MGIPNTELRISDGTFTVQSFCSKYNCSIQQLMASNSNNFTVRNKEDYNSYLNYLEDKKNGKNPSVSNYSPLVQLFIKEELSPLTAVNNYLSVCNKNNIKIVRGLVLNIPVTTNGGIREAGLGKYYMNNPGIPKLLTNNYTKEFRNAMSVERIAGFRSNKEAYGETKKVTCKSYFQRIGPNEEHKLAYLPVIPEEFSDSNSANWSPVSLMGRSVDYQIYTGSSREVAFTLKLHRELYNDSVNSGLKNIYNLVKLIESSCYPYYSDAWAGPPQVVFKIGNHVYIKGVLTSCSVNWKLPIDFETGLYTNCDISVSVKETNGPYGALDIAGTDNGGYGSYRSESVQSDPIYIEPRVDEDNTDTGTTTSNVEFDRSQAYGGGVNVQEVK